MQNVKQTNQEVPAETARIARGSFPKGNGYLRLRDKQGPLFIDEDFADLYSWKGENEIPPSILATITVLQFAEGYTDRQAVLQVCARIDWKYLLAVEITYDGFDFSALSRFRSRLVAHDAFDRLFELPLKQMKEMGLIRGRSRQRTDSTSVLAQIRTLNSLELLGETMRQALNEVAKIAPEWVQSLAPAEWFKRYGTRIENTKLPTEKTKRDALAQTIGQDGYQLLAVVAQPDAPKELFDTLAIQVLRMVWIQHYYGPESCELRKKEDIPPAHYMINSPYDTEAQFSRKRDITWTGYKVHLTEICDDELPNLITHVETTPATEPDCVTLSTIHDALDEKGLLPAEHIVDAGYTTTDNFVDSQQDKNIKLIGPARPDVSWQAREKNAYDISLFVIDWQAQQVTCPQGKTSNLWSYSTDAQGDESITVRFPKADCLSCQVRELCTRSKRNAPRGLQLQPSQLHHETLLNARTYQLTEEFHERYRPRAGIEGTISQATRSFEMRRTRYIGFAKTSLQHLATATSINLSRLNHWWQNNKTATTRTSAFLELQPKPTT